MSDTPTYRNSLTLGSMLNEYRLDSVLGAGGFGMTYLGWDVNLEKHVAIKEYLPGELAIRALDGSIVPVNTESEYNYKWGLERFIQEARTLARFSHPNIVRVNRYFEANGTSYMVMDYEAGESLNQYLKRNPAPAEAWLKQFLMPILDGLQAVHKAGFLHRDIKPSNVFMRENGTPVLLDFGSARLAAGANSKSLTAIVSPGYAPIEQYAGDGNQGPWSDIYALAGVMFRAITGENPPDAVKRMRGDTVSDTLARARGRYDERFLRAIEWGLSLEERMRPKSVEEWRALFSGRAPVTALDRGALALTPAADPATSAPTVRNPVASPPAGVARSAATARNGNSRVITRTRWKWLRRAAFVLVLALAAGVYLKQRALEREWRETADRARSGALAPDIERGLTQRFESADADRSGALTRAELAQRVPAYAARFDEIDRNADGLVSLAELTAFMEKAGLASELRASEAKAPSSPTTPAAPVATTAPAGVEVLPELNASQRTRLLDSFRFADVDRNGSLSRDEVSARMRMLVDKFDAVDTDRDGRLSLAEVETVWRRELAAKQGGTAEATAQATAIPAPVFQEFAGADRNGDGYLSSDEIRGRFPFIERNFQAVDSDGDGRISPAELAALRERQKLPKGAP